MKTSVRQIFYINSEDLEDYEKIFKLIDKKGEGFLKTDSIADFFLYLGYKPFKKELTEMVEEADANGDGKIDSNDFAKFMVKNKSRMEAEENLRAAFKIFDTNESGTISRSALRKFVLRIGAKMTEVELTDMLEEADQDDDGVISYDEFVKIVTA